MGAIPEGADGARMEDEDAGILKRSGQPAAQRGSPGPGRGAVLWLSPPLAFCRVISWNGAGVSDARMALSEKHRRSV